MELSICIPIYQCDVKTLVSQLIKQAKAQLLDYEICLIDDDSNEQIKSKNRELLSWNAPIRLTELDQNVGRSKIRNKLAEMATGKYLLFLDCDVLVDNQSFIRNYVEYAHENYQSFTEGVFLYGGYKYKHTIAERQGKELRYYYGKYIEEATLNELDEVIEMPFLGGNFFVESRVFNTIKFDETITKYGYEDLLFHMDFQSLSENPKDIAIHNPVTIKQIDKNEEYLLKTRQAMENLAELYANNRIIIENHLRILMAHQQLKNKGLIGVFRKTAPRFLPLLIYNLTSSKPNLKLFQFYKLIHFVQALEDNKSD